MRGLAGLVIGLALAACATDDMSRQSAPAPVKGWLASYDEMIVVEAAKYPELARIPAARVGALCPKWEALDESRRRRFYADLLRTMARHESSHDRSVMALEKTMGIDRITGKPVVSEGLLQLSYQDQQNYRGCTFDFAADRAKFEEDWSLQDARKIGETDKIKSWTAKNNDRSILLPGPHFACAVFVVGAAVRSDANAGRSLADSLMRYWSVLNERSNPATYRKIVAGLATEAPYCR